MKSRTRTVNICPFIFLEPCRSPGLSGSVFGENLSLYRLPKSILNFILPPACKELKNSAQLPALGLQVELVVQPSKTTSFYYIMGLHLGLSRFTSYLFLLTCRISTREPLAATALLLRVLATAATELRLLMLAIPLLRRLLAPYY